jgi:type IV pilus assembly protein PilN
VLRANLSTRPFYNERAVQLLLILAGVLVLALTVFNVTRIVSLSRDNTGLSSRASSDRAEAERLRAEAATIRRGINQAELKTIVAAAEEANILIDQRTFSWTEFFNRIEETLPPDVMLTEVKPSFHENETIISMMVLGRRTEDVDEFIEKLEATGAFDQVLPKNRDVNEDNLTRVLITATYRAGDVERTATGGPAGAAAGGQ